MELLLLYQGAEDPAPLERKVRGQLMRKEGRHWYLDAYCHTRKAPRSFRLDRIRSLTVLDTGEVLEGPAIKATLAEELQAEDPPRPPERKTVKAGRGCLGQAWAAWRLVLMAMGWFLLAVIVAGLMGWIPENR